jgi:hypothetical protein
MRTFLLLYLLSVFALLPSLANANEPLDWSCLDSVAAPSINAECGLCDFAELDEPAAIASQELLDFSQLAPRTSDTGLRLNLDGSLMFPESDTALTQRQCNENSCPSTPARPKRTAVKPPRSTAKRKVLIYTDPNDHLPGNRLCGPCAAVRTQLAGGTPLASVVFADQPPPLNIPNLRYPVIWVPDAGVYKIGAVSKAGLDSLLQRHPPKPTSVKGAK